MTRLRYEYIKYTPVEYSEILGKQFERVFFRPQDKKQKKLLFESGDGQSYALVVDMPPFEVTGELFGDLKDLENRPILAVQQAFHRQATYSQGHTIFVTRLDFSFVMSEGTVLLRYQWDEANEEQEDASYLFSCSPSQERGACIGLADELEEKTRLEHERSEGLRPNS